jgi:hypothetical protein
MRRSPHFSADCIVKITGLPPPLASVAAAPAGSAREPDSPRQRCLGDRRSNQEQVMREEAGRKVETSVEARAGFLDRPVLAVLCASLALIVVAFGALWLFGT